MKHRLLAAVLLGAALLFIMNLPVAQRPEKPCIVLISIDTLRADHLGCYGYPLATSPQIDAFRRESVQFMRAYSQAPSTAASHMSLFTGLLPPVHRITNTVTKDRSDLRRLHPGVTTLAEILKANGYLTAAFHGGGNVAGAFGFDRGFDLYPGKAFKWNRVFFNPRLFRPMRSWMQKSLREKKPLFLFLHHYICHDPYLHAPPAIMDRFVKDPQPGLPLAPPDLKRPTHPNESPSSLFWKKIDGTNADHRRHVMSLYDAGVNFSDFVFGNVQKILKEEGLYDKALIILLSDHGEEFWEHGDTKHWRLFRESLHVPLIIRFPGAAAAGSRLSMPVRQFDVMPTILEYLGIQPLHSLQAASLLPLISGKSQHAPRLASFSDQFDHVRFLDSGLSYSNQPSQGIGEWLFDLRLDPCERRNLAASKPSLLPRLRALAAAILQKQKMLRRQRGLGDELLLPMGENLREELESLGYL
jgi:arylsulfatase A-like enzyme